MNSGLPLDTLANTIKAGLKKSDQMLIATGEHLKEARTRVAEGEAGDGIDWKRWLAIHQIGEEKAKVCLRIANDPNPEQALVVHRENVRQRVRKHRAEPATVGSYVTPDRSESITTHQGPFEPIRSLVRDPIDDPWVQKMLALLAEGTPAQLDCIKAWLAS